MLPVLSAKRTPLPFSETQYHPLDGSTPPAARLIRTSLDKLAEALIDPPEPHTKAHISELEKAQMMSPMLEAFRVQGTLVVMGEMEVEFGQYYTQHLEHRTHWKHSLAQVQADPDFAAGEVDITLAAALWNALNIVETRMQRYKISHLLRCYPCPICDEDCDHACKTQEQHPITCRCKDHKWTSPSRAREEP